MKKRNQGISIIEIIAIISCIAIMIFIFKPTYKNWEKGTDRLEAHANLNLIVASIQSPEFTEDEGDKLLSKLDLDASSKNLRYDYFLSKKTTGENSQAGASAFEKIRFRDDKFLTFNSNVACENGTAREIVIKSIVGSYTLNKGGKCDSPQVFAKIIESSLGKTYEQTGFNRLADLDGSACIDSKDGVMYGKYIQLPENKKRM